MAGEANGCLRRSRLRASDRAPMEELSLPPDLSSLGIFWSLFLRKDGFELQRLLTTIRKSPHQYSRSFQIFAGQYLTVHLFVFLLP